jgi:hypothetical protein
MKDRFIRFRMHVEHII